MGFRADADREPSGRQPGAEPGAGGAEGAVHTPLRRAALFRQMAPRILRMTLAYIEGGRVGAKDGRIVRNYLTAEALDPHANRHRLLASFTA